MGTFRPAVTTPQVVGSRTATKLLDPHLPPRCRPPPWQCHHVPLVLTSTHNVLGRCSELLPHCRMTYDRNNTEGPPTERGNRDASQRHDGEALGRSLPTTTAAMARTDKRQRCHMVGWLKADPSRYSTDSKTILHRNSPREAPSMHGQGGEKPMMPARRE